MSRFRPGAHGQFSDRLPVLAILLRLHTPAHLSNVLSPVAEWSVLPSDKRNYGSSFVNVNTCKRAPHRTVGPLGRLPANLDAELQSLLRSTLVCTNQLIL